MNMIEITGLCKSYPLYKNKRDKLREAFSLEGKQYHSDFHALDHVTFRIEKGECVGLIGLNGSGKSTLLKIITGVVAPTAGDMRIHGSLSALLELGAGFNPEYSGLENVYLNSMLMGYSRAETEEKLDAILSFADIGDFIHQPVKTYSSGMFVRLAFSIAINVEPEILIVDEALSVGDVFFQQKCYRKLKELTGKCTVLIVSHDLNALTKFCRRILVLHHGSLAFDGEPQEAVTRYFQIRQGDLTRATAELSHQPFVMDSERLARYREPDAAQYSGNMNVLIERYYYEINGAPFAETCCKNDSFHIAMIVTSKIELTDLIIGYQVRDKYGNEVFGQTSLTSHVRQFALKPGRNAIQFEFIWPEIREGDYFITLGIGNGTDVLNQVEECWINQAIHVVANVSGKTIFGVFNQEMEQLQVLAME